MSVASPADADAIAQLRELARLGTLSAALTGVSGVRRRMLVGATYAVAMPVVYARLTQKMEARRGHLRCATSVRHLSDDCLDRFEDDMEAVVEDVGRRACVPIRDLEAWIASRVTMATVDGYRRRRGAVGALQRPRLPAWLARALDGDLWLCDLALRVLVWAGSPATAGAQTWPMESWAAVRPAHRTTGSLRADLDHVLTTMRTRAAWFEMYVETPLGHKQPPVAHMPHNELGDPVEQAALRLVDWDAQDDAHMRLLAYQAFRAIAARTHRGEPAHAVVADVIGTVFGDNGADPCGGHTVTALLRDPVELERIVGEVLALVEAPGTL
jgi:hypothetical protein